MPKSGSRRKSERAFDLIPTFIDLKGRRFQVSNISSEGIGIIIEDDGPRFFTGERLEKIPLPLENGTVNLKGAVTHISVTGSGTICGIRFIFSGNEFDSIVRFVKERTRSRSSAEKTASGRG